MRERNMVEVYDGRCMKIYLTKNILVSGVI